MNLARIVDLEPGFQKIAIYTYTASHSTQPDKKRMVSGKAS
jgi:hypothetical protein